MNNEGLVTNWKMNVEWTQETVHHVHRSKVTKPIGLTSCQTSVESSWQFVRHLMVLISGKQSNALQIKHITDLPDWSFNDEWIQWLIDYHQWLTTRILFMIWCQTCCSCFHNVFMNLWYLIWKRSQRSWFWISELSEQCHWHIEQTIKNVKMNSDNVNR